MLSLLLLVAAALAAPPPTTAPARATCQQQITVDLTGPWSLPLTAFADFQDCAWIFNVPADSYAVATVIGTDMNFQGFASETINFYDRFNHIYNQKSSNDYHVYNYTTAWADQFNVGFHTSGPTEVKVQIDIVLRKKTLGQNVAQTISVATNGPSPVLYTNDFKDGETYQISAQTVASLGVAVKTLYAFNGLNNVFVYDNGRHIGSLLNLYMDYNTVKSQNVQLYVANHLNADERAAIMITDHSNIADLNQISVYYATPGDHHSVLLPGSPSWRDPAGTPAKMGAVTLIGDKDGSARITVSQLEWLNDNDSAFSYLPGGPLKSRSKDVQLEPSKMPQNFAAVVNTFMIAQKEASMTYNVY